MPPVTTDATRERIIDAAEEFRIITSLIVMDRKRDADGLRRFPRTYVVPVITGGRHGPYG